MLSARPVICYLAPGLSFRSFQVAFTSLESNPRCPPARLLPSPDAPNQLIVCPRRRTVRACSLLAWRHGINCLRGRPWSSVKYRRGGLLVIAWNFLELLVPRIGLGRSAGQQRLTTLGASLRLCSVRLANFRLQRCGVESTLSAPPDFYVLASTCTVVPRSTADQPRLLPT